MKDNNPHPPGITLRDWFAGQALAGWLARDSSAAKSTKSIAEGCYCYADAMIEVRLAPKEGLDGAD